MESWWEICRQVGNDGLRERQDGVKSRKSPVNACRLGGEYIIPADAPRPTYASQCQAFSCAQKDHPQLKIPQSQVWQQALKPLETVWVAMYRRGFGFPRFRKKGRFRSFVFPQVKEPCIEGNQIDLPKIGKLRFFKSRALPESFVVKQVRVLKRASGYYIILSLPADVEVPQPPMSEHAIGLDMGKMSYLAPSEGELIDNPQLFVKASGKLKSLRQKLKRKQKSSRRWHLIQHPIAKLYEHVTKSRKDFFLKWAHHLCHQADRIFAEALNLKALGRSQLGKFCLDAAWGEFLCFGVAQHKSILSWVGFKRSKYFAKKDSFLLPLRRSNPSRRSSSTSGLESRYRSRYRKYVPHRAEKSSLRVPVARDGLAHSESI
uniref:RNA-guided endonuclease InsQ/TnpB family protein n=1 Tax=Geitlerinema sp. PCC 9228 TaxID=111611 RepID=UPI0008F9CCA5|nr:RNA-guided endonuclease TnpB family protein [Geitlerinema sp. PCC 9228]